MKTGFIYIWYDRKRKMYYIGKHLGTEDDGYICSSDRMRDAYQYRPHDFKRRIIQRNVPRDLLSEEEFKWLSLIKDEELNTRYYNVCRRFCGGFYGNHSEETKQKLREARAKQVISHSEATRKKQSEARKGMMFTEEHRKNLSEAHKGKRQPLSEETKRKISEKHKGKPRPYARVPRSDEVKEKISKSNKGKPKSIEHRKATSEGIKLWWASKKENDNIKEY